MPDRPCFFLRLRPQREHLPRHFWCASVHVHFASNLPRIQYLLDPAEALPSRPSTASSEPSLSPTTLPLIRPPPPPRHNHSFPHLYPPLSDPISFLIPAFPMALGRYDHCFGPFDECGKLSTFEEEGRLQSRLAVGAVEANCPRSSENPRLGGYSARDNTK